jgi:hypothetical protein
MLIPSAAKNAPAGAGTPRSAPRARRPGPRPGSGRWRRGPSRSRGCVPASGPGRGYGAGPSRGHGCGGRHRAQPALLLDVQVEQFARPIPFLAADHPAELAVAGPPAVGTGARAPHLGRQLGDRAASRDALAQEQPSRWVRRALAWATTTSGSAGSHQTAPPPPRGGPPSVNNPQLSTASRSYTLAGAATDTARWDATAQCPTRAWGPSPPPTPS